MTEHRHEFVPAPPLVEYFKAFGEVRELREARPDTFVCSVCGLEVTRGGALSQPREAHEASYRPDLPLRSTEANVAAWADKVRRGSA